MKKFLFGCAIFISCTNQSGEPTRQNDSAIQDGTLLKDTLSTQKDSSQSFIKKHIPNGIYQATLPCADCKSLLHTIAFYPNNTFRLEEESWGKIPAVVKTAGSWTMTSNTISLYKEQLVVSQYNFRNDTVLYKQGNKEYPLIRLTAASENEVWRNKKREGLEFFGIANEPFWNIEIDEQNKIAFQLADWGKSIMFPAVKPVSSGDSIMYKTTNDSGLLQVTVYNQFCNDGMSDFIYNNKIKAVYKGKEYIGCGLLFK